MEETDLWKKQKAKNLVWDSWKKQNWTFVSKRIYLKADGGGDKSIRHCHCHH